mmetsp:Transcript_67969/g.76103  ORF Transcript_67969/g.76103 Transcript_67969/m.76103 type:complete len:350 (+) Transcript_67969:139-1188(+)
MGRKQKLRKASKKENATVSEDKPLITFVSDPKYPVYSPIFLGLLADAEDKTTTTPNLIEIKSKWKIAGASHGCVHSMNSLGTSYGAPQSKEFHLATPWLLESAIRGSEHGLMMLCMIPYSNAKPKPEALSIYWHRFSKKYDKDDCVRSTKTLVTEATRSCVVCLRQDSKTFTLLQCDQCSLYCYCSSDCQRNHWLSGHKAECNQVRILTKYHKPYANEIRKAAMRGDIVIPALEKLRYKLGLSRPKEDYEELIELHTGSTQGDPRKYVTARDDGTVWVGSFPHPTGPSSDTTTTTTTIDDIMTMKVSAMKTELKSYGIYTGAFIEKSEFVDALQKARNDADRKPSSTAG